MAFEMCFIFFSPIKKLCKLVGATGVEFEEGRQQADQGALPWDNT